MKNLSIIVAIAENNAIGKENKLLWHISDDLKRFKKLTTNHKIVMGKKTFESLPNGPLPNRVNLVISDNKEDDLQGCEMAYSIEEAIMKCDDGNENFIIGGGMIYKQFLPLSNKLYLTQVHEDFDGDVFFPEIDYSKWNLIKEERNQYCENSKLKYSYLIFERNRL